MFRKIMTVAIGALACLASPALADVEWTWSFNDEAGTFTTDGSPGAGTFRILDFSVTASAVGGTIGSVSGGDYAMAGFATDPPYDIVFDGNVVTLWLHSGGNTFDWNVYQQANNINMHYLFAWDSGNINDPTKAAYYDAGQGRELSVGTVTVTQVVGGYHLSLSGACPGRVTVQWSGGTPNSQHAIIFGNNLGSFTIPNNQPCGGTVLGITGQVQIVDPPGIFSNQGGSGSVSGNAGTAACGHYLQLVEGGTCLTSNTAQIP